MKRTSQPPQRPHEVELHLRRIERQMEDRKLTLLKAQLQSKVNQPQIAPAPRDH
jgi:hypothetical protein